MLGILGLSKDLKVHVKHGISMSQSFNVTAYLVENTQRGEKGFKNRKMF